MYIFSIISAIVLLILLAFYIAFYIFLSQRVKQVENTLLGIFHKKISKIPALIEVMRPYIRKKEAFDPMTLLHTESMIGEYSSIYGMLGQNGKIQNEFLFLMELSAHVPELQKHEYFLYIRDFIIAYERDMRWRFREINTAIILWNRFIRIKNTTLIGYFLPGRYMDEVD